MGVYKKVSPLCTKILSYFYSLMYMLNLDIANFSSIHLPIYLSKKLIIFLKKRALFLHIFLVLL